MSTLSTRLNKETDKSHHIQRGRGQGSRGGEHLGTYVLSPSLCPCLSRSILPGSVKRTCHWAVPTLGSFTEALPGIRWHHGGTSE